MAAHVAQEPLTIFFMVEPGPLELQAHLLIASLEVNCRDAYRLVAFYRDDWADDLNPATKDFLASTKTVLRTLTNTFADGYPAGNKLIAASLVKASGWSLFMDTDTMLARPTSFMSQAAGCRLAGLGLRGYRKRMDTFGRAVGRACAKHPDGKPWTQDYPQRRRDVLPALQCRADFVSTCWAKYRRFWAGLA